MIYNLMMRHRTPPQKRISASRKRFNVAVWGRQSGKTTFGLDKTIFAPLRGRSGGVYWYVLQTFAAAEVAFKRYLRLIDQTPIFKSKNKSDKWVELCNRATVHFKSGKNYQDLRLETLDGVVIDEVRQQHPDLWPMIIRPMLGRRKGWCDFLSTTNGFDHFKDIYDYALAHSDEWATFQAPSTEAPWWTQSEVESARGTMSEDVFAQEIQADFREIGVGKAYKNHNSAIHGRLDNPFAIRGMEWSPFLPFIVGLDFNVGLMVWVIGQKKGYDWYWGDEIALENTDTEQCAKVLAEKIKRHQSMLFNTMPPVVLVGDASGKARKTSAVGQTDYLIIERVLREHNIPFENRTPSENPGVKDRVNCVNSVLRAADGSVHMWYHMTRCKHLKRDCERVKWKQGADGAFLDKKSDPKATHASDAMGYPVTLLSDMLKRPVGKMRVLMNS